MVDLGDVDIVFYRRIRAGLSFGAPTFFDILSPETMALVDDQEPSLCCRP